MLAAGTAAAAQDGTVQANFELWQLVVFIPIAAVLGGQVGYWIGRNVGTAMFKPNARFLKQRYLDEAHLFFEQRGPFAIVIARFVPIVRTLAPITAGAAKMNYGGLHPLQRRRGGGRVGNRPDGARLLARPVRDHPEALEPIVIGIVVLSVLPMAIEWYKRRKAAKQAGIPTPPMESGEQTA